MIIPVITLWQPWASWVSFGWKPIETRTHTKFRKLVGKTIAIHAGKKWDTRAFTLAKDFLKEYETEKHEVSLREFKNLGNIVCIVKVTAFEKLNSTHSKKALIDCESVVRYGLFLDDIKRVIPMSAKGKQGIWSIDDSKLQPYIYNFECKH